MTLSDNGRGVLELLNLLCRQQEDCDTLTEEQLKLKLAQVLSLRKVAISEEEKEVIVRKMMALIGVYKPEDEAIVNSGEYTTQCKDWFTRIKNEHCEWFLNYQNKLYAKGWSPNVIRELDKSTDTIMDFLGDPKNPSFNIRGLIMGDIQSGKTANFIALCNKAADAGYRVIIVTAGIIEKLRQQTQGRLDREFVDLLPAKRVVKLTGEAYDFRKEQGENPVHVFRDDVPVLCVVKKNVSVLKHLCNWLHKGIKTAPGQDDVKLMWPLLFIDDEADNASINTRDPDEDNPTKTNEFIRKILKLFRRSSYVGITATPFANVFIDPDTEDKVVADDLFPKSFVYRLTTPSNYFGVAKLFEAGSPYLKIIDDIEFWLPATHKKEDYPSSELPESLQTAIGYFLLVNGVMDVIGRDGDDIKHRTMMIHISRFIAMQNRLTGYIEDYIKRIISRVSNYCADPKKAKTSPELIKLHQIWRDFQLSRMCNNMHWDKFRSTVLLDAIRTIEIVTVNSGNSVKALDYSQDGKRYIVIGGNALSRGLTLEGLVVSYFRRQTILSDTLLQMGRWCGYRGIYQSLVRVWMPQSAVDNFGYASEISEDLGDVFHQIVEQGGSPKDFAFKIRKDPGAMLPTARNKMRSATRVSFPVDLSGHAIETPRILNDASVIAENNSAVCDFIIENFSRLEKPPVGTNLRFLRGVKPKSIINLLARFKAGAMSYGLSIPQIRDVIAQMDSDWDVAFMTSGSGFYADGKLPVPIMKATRKLLVTSEGREIAISGTKLKVTSGGVMKHILTPEEQKEVLLEYCKLPGRENRSPSDSVYLSRAKQLHKRPLLVLQYVTLSSLCEGSQMKPEASEFFALSFGFPGSTENQLKQVFYCTKKAVDELTKQKMFDGEKEE